MILHFKDSETERLFQGQVSRKLPADIQRTALRKLQYLHAAASLEDLRRVPGHRLEKLKGDREGQWSIRINDQWRICFEWEEGNAREVEIADYH
jgi:proteic killer suppression protein